MVGYLCWFNSSGTFDHCIFPVSRIAKEISGKDEKGNKKFSKSEIIWYISFISRRIRLKLIYLKVNWFYTSGQLKSIFSSGYILFKTFMMKPWEISSRETMWSPRQDRQHLRTSDDSGSNVSFHQQINTLRIRTSKSTWGCWQSRIRSILIKSYFVKIRLSIVPWNMAIV